jgi:cyclohexanecarboxylate-CoA ligase
VLDDRVASDQVSGFILEQERIAREAKAGFWPERTLIDYFNQSLVTHPADEYLTAYEEEQSKPVSLSYSELSLRVSSIAANLRRLGVGRGDIISYQIPNWWHFIAVHLACIRIGAISNPLMPIFREHELDFMLGSSGAKVLIVPRKFRKFDHERLAARVRERVPTLEHVVVIGGAADDSFESRLLRPTKQDTPNDESGLLPNDVMKIMYTSGTTGEPKGVMHTSNTLLCSMKSVTERLGLTRDDVIFMPSPFAHSIGFCYGVLMSLYLGARLITMDVWDPVRAAEIMERRGVTFMFGATPFVSDLVNLPGIGRRDLGCFRLFLTAGAPIPPTLVEEGRSVLGARIVPGYGMTELGLVSSVLPSAPDLGSGTDGLAMPHVEVRVVDDSLREVGRGKEGELQCRGSSMFVGYHGRPELYELDEQGWFSTGDLATMDEYGYIRIVGRSKDIIIRGGENIPVVEVEYLMHEMPQVAEVAIVGTPDERLGERSCALVSLHDGQELTLRQVTDYLESRKLAKQYLPEKLVIIDSMPKTPAGKLQKFKLREWASR